MPQPKIPLYYRMTLELLELQASCYQPVTLFKKNGRKLPHVAEPGDPWEVFLRSKGHFGIIGKGVGDTLDEALDAALKNRTGLKPAMQRLVRAIDELMDAMYAC